MSWVKKKVLKPPKKKKFQVTRIYRCFGFKQKLHHLQMAVFRRHPKGRFHLDTSCLMVRLAYWFKKKWLNVCKNQPPTNSKGFWIYFFRLDSLQQQCWILYLVITIWQLFLQFHMPKNGVPADTKPHCDSPCSDLLAPWAANEPLLCGPSWAPSKAVSMLCY